MKKLSVFIVGMVLFTSAYSQKCSPDSCKFRPCEGSVGLTGDITGIISNIGIAPQKDYSGNNILMLRYFVKNDIAVRLGFGFNYHQFKKSTVDSIFTTGLPSLMTWDTIAKRTDLYFSPGVEKHFNINERLVPYVGAELMLGKIGKTKYKSIRSIKDTTQTSEIKIDGNWSGGSNVGVNLIAGCNVYLIKALAIGAEYHYGFNVLSTGGDWQNVIIEDVTPSNSSSTSTSKTYRSEGSNLEKTINSSASGFANLKITYFFNR